MATSFATGTFPRLVKVTFADTDCVLVNIPDGTKKVSVYFVATAGTVAFTGTDGDPQAATAAPIPAAGWHEFSWRYGGASLYVAGSAAAVCHVCVEA